MFRFVRQARACCSRQGVMVARPDKEALQLDQDTNRLKLVLLDKFEGQGGQP